MRVAVGRPSTRYREDRLVMKRAGVSLTLSALLLIAACGQSDERTILVGGFDQSDPTECADAGDTTVTVDAARLDQLMGQPSLNGTVTIRMLAREDPPGSFEDPFLQQPTIAEGKFVAYRYSLSNNTNAEVQPDTHVNDSLRLTDGSRSWPFADYSGSHQTGVSSAWAEIQGDEQTATMVGAGFNQATWVVFDIPTDAEPTGLALGLDSGEQECIGLPR